MACVTTEAESRNEQQMNELSMRPIRELPELDSNLGLPHEILNKKAQGFSTSEVRHGDGQGIVN